MNDEMEENDNYDNKNNEDVSFQFLILKKRLVLVVSSSIKIASPRSVVDR